MRIYASHAKHFIEDCERNQITERMRLGFESAHGYTPGPSEIQSWRNSLRALAMVLGRAGLVDQGVLLEYKLPQTSKRIDCVLCGFAADGQPAALIIELKQWETCKEAEGPNEVISFVNGRERELLHPSEQARRYAQYLEDSHEAFYADPQPLLAVPCAYLHNYLTVRSDPLRSGKFTDLLAASPLFTSDDVDDFVDFIRRHVGHGDGLVVLSRVEQSRYRPSKRLMEHVAAVIENDRSYLLLDEQQVAFDSVFTALRNGVHNRTKQVVIVKGGPGTGKSVIAMNLVAALLRSSYSAHYVTGSKAFTETMRKIIGTRGADLFTYSNNYMQSPPDAVDVLITDEAHRIREVSSNRFTPASKKSGMSQLEELIRACRVSVFLIDDAQVVRPGEIGSAEYIRAQAQELGCTIQEYELSAQFRCNGSERFVRWVSASLGLGSASVDDSPGSEFDFRIFRSPAELDLAIREKAASGHSARMMAGYCWPWSDPNDDGTLPNDVVVAEFARPWNAKPDAGRLAKGIPKSNFWAYQSGGIDQVGCVYTAQGFEFDYAGVIFGNDLRYDSATGAWLADKTKNYDGTVKRSGAALVRLLQNTYRVLLSRGIKGCYVCFLDEETEAYFKSRLGAFENGSQAV
ncbi:DUF2075 domain-containing protein [Duganella sp. FT50W]|uniref:DUF2075 domain-containing protein n=1 Tax=Duganella lactea TaxID=2692173 RepID=A0A6L8MMJ8_9BURK|nr:DUF2075 domain-containing protein [Duganella lactea]MYM84133.1 DUF2075 domain-containing protein [Duganella lactea]